MVCSSVHIFTRSLINPVLNLRYYFAHALFGIFKMPLFSLILRFMTFIFLRHPQRPLEPTLILPFQ